MATGNPVGGRRSTKWVQITEDDEDQSEPDLPIWVVGRQASRPLMAVVVFLLCTILLYGFNP